MSDRANEDRHDGDVTFLDLSERKPFYRQAWIWALVALVVIVAGTWWYLDRYVWVREIDRVNRMLEAARQTAEAERARSLQGFLAQDYRDASGLDRKDILPFIVRFFLETNDLQIRYVHVLHEDPDLPASATRATLILVAAISGKDRSSDEAFQGIAGAGGDAFLLRLVKEDGEWRVVYSKRLDASSPDALLQQLREE